MPTDDSTEDIDDANLGDPIPRDEPFVVPASPEETFDSVWLRNINISVPATAQSGSTEGNIHIECLPYEADVEKIYTTPDNTMNIPSHYPAINMLC